MTGHDLTLYAATAAIAAAPLVGLALSRWAGSPAPRSAALAGVMAAACLVVLAASALGNATGGSHPH